MKFDFDEKIVGVCNCDFGVEPDSRGKHSISQHVVNLKCLIIK